MASILENVAWGLTRRGGKDRHLYYNECAARCDEEVTQQRAADVWTSFLGDHAVARRGIVSSENVKR
jgi:hypothetical protein